MSSYDCAAHDYSGPERAYRVQVPSACAPTISLERLAGDGRTDLLVNSVNTNLLRNMGTEDGITTFRDVGTLSPLLLAGHTTSPSTVDWNADDIPDLIIGGEDGFLYYHRNPRSP